MSNGPPFSHGTFSREFFGWQWRTVRKMPRKRPGWVPFCGLSPGEKLFKGYWRCLVPLENQSGRLVTGLARKLEELSKNKWNQNISHSFPLWPMIVFFWKEIKGIWKKQGGVRKVGKTSRREPGWVPFCGLNWHQTVTKVHEIYFAEHCCHVYQTHSYCKHFLTLKPYCFWTFRSRDWIWPKQKGCQILCFFFCSRIAASI